MAAAFGRPVVVLFGSSDVDNWRPWRTENVVLTSADGIHSIEVSEVVERYRDPGSLAAPNRRMTELRRLLRYVRPYLAPLLLSVILMALVGAAQGFTALLIGPIFDRVLNPASAGYAGAAVHHPAVSITPSICKISCPPRFTTSGPWWPSRSWPLSSSRALCDYFGNYFINYVGFSAVTDLRQTVFDRVLRQDAHFFESNSTGRVMSSIMNDIEKIQVATSHMLADWLRQTLHRGRPAVRGAPKGLAARRWSASRCCRSCWCRPCASAAASAAPRAARRTTRPN